MIPMIAPPVIEIIDSRSDQTIVFIIVNDKCIVPVKKSELKNTDKILKLIDNECYGLY